MNKLYQYALGSLLLLSACQESKQEAEKPQLQAGTWRIALASEGGEIPFLLELSPEDSLWKGYLVNAEEKILLENIRVKGDSLEVPLHIFDAALLIKFQKDSLQGVFRKYYAPDKDQALSGAWGQPRFAKNTEKPAADFSGKWQVNFSNAEGKSYPAVGLFEQKEERITGTFLTETGDYRYLEGIVQGTTLTLSAFDGNHAFLFKAGLQGDSLVGEFRSGSSYRETWTAQRNEEARLRDAYTLTYLKEGYERIDFAFPDLQGQTRRLSDAQYQNKVVILQIFGSWCPNCMDETAFLADWYRKNKNQDVAIIALAYERKPDFDYARRMVERVVKRYQAEYEFLIAGTNNKEEAARTLPMLNQVMSFPTTIFIDKKGKVRKIHTGFNGPGTGAYYEAFREEFNNLMAQLLKE